MLIINRMPTFTFFQLRYMKNQNLSERLIPAINLYITVSPTLRFRAQIHLRARLIGTGSPPSHPIQLASPLHPHIVLRITKNTTRISNHSHTNTPTMDNQDDQVLPVDVPRLPPQMFTTAAQLLDLTDSMLQLHHVQLRISS